tara:strand:+ start:218 stop:835 length:618 start_codon:yes stop_codon:yes gene_type:complete
MIYMTRYVTYIFGMLLVCSSCSYISYNQVLPLIKSATLGDSDIALTEEYIAKQPYSFARVDLGKAANIIMVLQKVDNNFYTWVSSTGEKIITLNGKIIKTEGLPHNLEFLNPTKFKLFSEKPNYSGTYDLLLKDPRAFVEQDFSISIIQNSPSELLIEEKITMSILNRKYSNFYWVDKKSGKVIKTKQAINPKLPNVRLDFIYKY